jgi:hypothetical protein
MLEKATLQFIFFSLDVVSFTLRPPGAELNVSGSVEPSSAPITGALAGSDGTCPVEHNHDRSLHPAGRTPELAMTDQRPVGKIP